MRAHRSGVEEESFAIQCSTKPRQIVSLCMLRKRVCWSFAPNEMKRHTTSALVVVLLLASFPVLSNAQDDLRSVQEELRRRSLYFGDVNGRDSAELQEATKRYQQRKGFAATGKPDRETLKS